MKNPDKVRRLLEELKAECNNDFEIHRVNVLERDFLAPPKADIVDDSHQKFDGITFSVTKRPKKFDNSKADRQAVKKAGKVYQRCLSIHRFIWSYYYGEIPEGCDIHHIDGNPHNNDISNLKLLPHENHMHLHREKWGAGGSATGVKHREESFTCINCGKEYTAVICNTNKFCSEKCKYKFNARKADIKPYGDRKVTVNCPVCGKIFERYRSTNPKYCSHECAQKASRGVVKSVKPPKKCAWCGKEFTSKDSQQVCCSLSCAVFLRESQRREEKGVKKED